MTDTTFDTTDLPPPDDEQGPPVEATIEPAHTESGREIAVLEKPGSVVLDPRNATALALATAARVEAEGRMALARQYPRSLGAVEQKLLADCQRPSFAASALYKRPAGKKFNEKTKRWEDVIITGFSIRFAEAVASAVGNIDVRSLVIYEDEAKSIVKVLVTDLEVNLTRSSDVEVSKTLERKTLRKGQKPIGTRVNSYGEALYIVPATPEEHEVKKAAAVAKQVRNLILFCLPPDIKESCRAQVDATLEAALQKDKPATVAKMVRAYSEIQISEAQLAAYLGHPLTDNKSTPPIVLVTVEEYKTLQAVYTGLKDGTVQWAEMMAERAGEGAKPADGSEPTSNSLTEELKAKAKAQKEKNKGKASKPEEKQQGGRPEDGGQDFGSPPPLDREPGAEG